MKTQTMSVLKLDSFALSVFSTKGKGLYFCSNKDAFPTPEPSLAPDPFIVRQIYTKRSV